MVAVVRLGEARSGAARRQGPAWQGERALPVSGSKAANGLYELVEEASDALCL